MGLLDLSKVSKMLIWVIDTGVRNSSIWPTDTEFSVSSFPPDLLQDAGANLGFYLYHVAEEPHTRNPPPKAPGGPGADADPIGLRLYYQLTAQVSTDQPESVYRAQLLMGCAIRTLHDYAIITDSSTIVREGLEGPILANSLFNLGGAQNRFRITMRPVPVEDSVTYWTAGDAPLRLAAYYQVSVVFLDGAPPVGAALPVLTPAAGVFAGGPPLLSGSQARVSLLVGTDSLPTTVLVQPAQVSTFSGAVGSGRFELLGSSLTGLTVGLQLRGSSWTRTVDPTLWGLVATAAGVSATVRDSVDDQVTVPGIYGASVVVQRSVMVGGQRSTVTHTSNETPIAIVPRLALDPVSAPPGEEVAVDGWLFEHADIPTNVDDARSTRVFVGETMLETVPYDPEGSLTPGQVWVFDEHTLTIKLPSDLVVGSVLPVRVSVNGVVSTPAWITVSAG